MDFNNYNEKELLQIYKQAKDAYYNGEEIMSDIEFDELEEYLGLSNKSKVGARRNEKYTINHPVLMGSLSKVQVKETMEKEEVELKKEKNLQKTLIEIKKKYGKNSVLKLMNLEEDAMSVKRNEQIGGHRA